MNWIAKWITPPKDMGDVCPRFYVSFPAENCRRATLRITAAGVYEARLNGARVGDYVLAPGWTSYSTRLQYQTYDITDLLRENNMIEVLVGKGWYRSPLGWFPEYEKNRWRLSQPCCMIAQIELETEDGKMSVIPTDSTWRVSESQIRFSELYDGEKIDGTFVPDAGEPACVIDHDMSALIPQEGEITKEIARIHPKRIFRTPKGELVADFVQNIAGYVEFTVDAKDGDKVEFSHGETLDKEGNFYNLNYQRADPRFFYTCRSGVQTVKPHLTYYGFRYIRLDRFPGEPKLTDLTAIAVSAEMRQTGRVSTGVPLLNRFLENVIWTQRNDHLEVPLDCPQRGERLGWTGDANLFFRTACLNYDVQKFYRKWLADMAADQLPNGDIPAVVPDVLGENGGGAWQDAVTMIPWQMYQTYGDPDILRMMFEPMKKYLRFIPTDSTVPYLWTGHPYCCDHIALDAPKPKPDEDPNSYVWWRGASRREFVGSAFYAQSCKITAMTARILGEDATEYEQLYEKIVDTIQKHFPEYTTQTECVLALAFGLAPDPEKTAAELARRIRDNGTALLTGTIGTSFVLDALSEHGYADVAYDLLLREAFPSWINMVKNDATTVWEHWDCIEPDGNVLNRYDGMTSFNHFALGNCMSWLYTQAAGIQNMAGYQGFEKIRFAPKPDPRMGHLEVSLETKYGSVFSGWYYEPTGLRVEVVTPVDAVLVLDGAEHTLTPGRHLFYF